VTVSVVIIAMVMIPVIAIPVIAIPVKITIPMVPSPTPIIPGAVLSRMISPPPTPIIPGADLSMRDSRDAARKTQNHRREQKPTK
jgi:hypothetical protein